MNGDLTVGEAEQSAFLVRLDQTRQHMRASSWRHFAGLVGVSTGAIEKWRRGDATPYAKTVAQIAERAGVRVEWLQYGAEPMVAEQPRAEQRQPAADEGRGDPHASEAAGGLGVSGRIDPDRLARAYEAALHAALAAAPGGQPDPRRLMQMALLLYDEMTEKEGAAKRSGGAS